jgi:hypothetical protein
MAHVPRPFGSAHDHPSAPAHTPSEQTPASAQAPAEIPAIAPESQDSSAVFSQPVPFEPIAVASLPELDTPPYPEAANAAEIDPRDFGDHEPHRLVGTPGAQLDDAPHAPDVRDFGQVHASDSDAPAEEPAELESLRTEPSFMTSGSASDDEVPHVDETLHALDPLQVENAAHVNEVPHFDDTLRIDDTHHVDDAPHSVMADEEAEHVAAILSRVEPVAAELTLPEPEPLAVASAAPTAEELERVAADVGDRALRYLSGEGHALIEARCQEQAVWLAHRITREIAASLEREIGQWVQQAIKDAIERRDPTK